MPANVAPAAIVLLGLGVFSGWCAFRFLLRQLSASGRPRRYLVSAGIGIGLLAFGARVWVAEGQVSWAPYLDQWNAEISGIVAPLAHGTLGWRDLVAGNNEHRVFLTRALSLAVILANGAWDNRVMVIGNYLLESFLVAWIGALAWSTLGWARGSYVAAAALLPMFLVCGWETITSSNQTQFVWMAFGSVVALSIAQAYSLRSAESWATLAIALLMLGSMASGFLTALAMMGTCLASAYLRRQNAQSAAAFCLVGAGIVAIGWGTRIPFPALYVFYAQSPRLWLGAFLAYGAWPLPAGLAGFIGMWLPWATLLDRTLRRKEWKPLTSFAIGLGLWVLLQAAALAWARAGLSGLVSSRYTTFLGWGVVANASALALIFPAPPAGRNRWLVSWAAMAIWLGGVASFEIWRSQSVYRPYLDGFRSQTREHEQRLGTFMRTDDTNVIDGVGFPQIPLYDPAQIISTLRDQQVQEMLPAPLRRDLVRDREPSVLPSVQDGPLSFAALRILRSGRGCAGLGLALLCVSFSCALTAAFKAKPRNRGQGG